MQFSTLLLLLGLALFLVLILHVEETLSVYPYAIRGFVKDVRANPFRFIGGLFFKKAFLLKKLKLKWKLKKKLVLKKLLKKLFLIGRKRRAIRFPDEDGDSVNSGLSSSSLSSSSSSFSPDYSASPSHPHYHHGSGSSPASSSSRAFFDDDSFHEFQSIGLGQQELDLLRQLPENLQSEYRQEMEELETSASEPREADIMEYLSATNEFDTDHCIAKGICEVMSRGNSTSNRFEHLLLEYYNEEPETRKDPDGAPAYIYDYAAFLGKSRRDARACTSYFPKCPEPTHQLSGFMDEIFSSEMCDPPPVANELK